MKLTFSNIGRFVEKTDVEINGITVIAGTNGTGKSTISKILYCIFDSLHETDIQIENNRMSSIERIISRPIRPTGRLNSMHEIAYVLSALTKKLVTYDDIVDVLTKYDYPLDQIDEVDTHELVEQILDVIKIRDDEILQKLVMARFLAEFNHDLKHVNYKNMHSEIELEIRDKHINITFDDETFSLNSEFELVKDMVYLDDISTFANLSSRYYLPSRFDPFSHTIRLRDKIFEPKILKNDTLDTIIAEKRYSNVVAKLNQMNIGDLIESSTGMMEYSAPGLNANLGMQSVSAGTKVLAVIKKLILNGYIEENGMIVLDEPEVHLHPEWQMALAEMIVALQSELGVNILINTHSADFVAFIQYYAEKMSVVDKCKYYQTKGNDNYTSTLVDVSDNVQAIFSELGLPFIRVTEEIAD